VTELVDPDGYALYFESPTDVAEETVYAGKNEEIARAPCSVPASVPLTSNL